jgi:hypothetical protein
MTHMGKVIIVLGVVMIVVGVIVWAIGRLGFRGLPGDIRYESDHVRVYFPVVSCIVLSVILTLAFWLWQRISK